ncbi:MAG: polysaccharide biosynthesis protein [Defluviitaleaceae bacterium]|nr:polysaccharide biosynthesis protein [Defluviitaleaceae bacterium]
MKPAANPFVKQAALLGVSYFIGRLLGFAYRLPLTSKIGDEGNAWYTTSHHVYAVMLIIVAGALPTVVSKLVSERVALGQYRNAHNVFKTTMTFATILGVAMGIIMWFGARWISDLLNSPQTFYAIRALAPTLGILGAIGTFRGYFLGMKTSMPVVLSQTAEQFFNAGFSILLAYIFFEAGRLHRSVAGAAAGTGIGALAGLLVLIFLYSLVQRDFKKRIFKDLNPPFENERGQLKIILLTALPIIAGTGLYALGTPIDQGMANARIAASGAFSFEEISILVGQFGGKFLLLSGLPVAMAIAISTAVIPEISSANSLNDKKGVGSHINTALRLAMLISIPSAVGMAVLADPILALLFPSFPEGGVLLRWGAVIVVFMAVNQILTGSLQGVGKVTMPLVAAFFALLVKIPVNYFLMAVPGINIMGAIISTIACYLVASGMNLFFLYKSTQLMPRFDEALIKPLGSSIVMGLSCWGLYRGLAVIIPNALATVLTLILGVVIYVVMMMLMRGLNSSDIAMLPLPKKAVRWLMG